MVMPCWALLAAAAAQPIAPVTIGDLVGVTDMSGLSVSPDGRLLAFQAERASLADDAVETRWLVVPTDGHGAARAIADGGAALFTGPGIVRDEQPRWLPDSSGFLFRAAIDGAVQVWRADLGLGAARRVTASDGDVLAFELSDAGRSIDVAAGPSRDAIRREEQRLHDQGARVDWSVDLSVGVIGGAPGVRGPKSVRLAGDWYDRRGLLADQPPRYFRQSLVTAAVEPIAQGPRWREYPQSDPAITASICKLRDCDEARPLWSIAAPALGGALVAMTDRAATQALYLWRGGALRLLYSAAGLASGSRLLIRPCAVRERSAYCVLAAADAPPRLVRIDLETGAARTLFAPNAALAARTEDRAELLRWRDRAGRAFAGQLILPRGRKPAAGFPLVVQYYLCEGFLRGGQGDELPFFPLAEKGIATLCINRHVDRRRRTDRLGDYRIAASGIAAAVRLLAAKGLVDPARIGMQGLSFGSEVTMWMVRRTGLLRAAAIASGQIEPTGYWFHAAPGFDFAAGQKEIWKVGDPDRDRAQWRDSSPARDADRITIPLLMQLPESEARWSIELIGRLRNAEKPVELFVFPDAPHVKALPRQKAAAYERNLAWFAYWLKGEAIETPSDPGRIRRWRALASTAPAQGAQP